MDCIYSVNGLELDDPGGRWKLHKATRFRAFPGRIASGASLPGRDGGLPANGSPFLPGRLSVTLTVYGDTHDSMMENLGALYGVFGSRHSLLTVRHEYEAGKVREALGEVTSTSEPETLLDNLCRIQFDISFPNVFWRDLAEVDSVLPIPQGTATAALVEQGGGTGPVNDALIRFQGGFTQATITDVVSGDQITVNQQVLATEYLVVDVANWVARLHSTDSWSLTSGTDAANSVISNRGMGPMFTLNPDFETGVGRYQLQVSGAIDTATAPTVAVRARRSFI